MTRGNQREIDRQRAQNRAEKNKGKAKHEAQTRGQNQGMALSNKMEKDADIMRQKQKLAEEKKQSSSENH